MQLDLAVWKCGTVLFYSFFSHSNSTACSTSSSATATVQLQGIEVNRCPVVKCSFFWPYRAPAYSSGIERRRRLQPRRRQGLRCCPRWACLSSTPLSPPLLQITLAVRAQKIFCVEILLMWSTKLSLFTKLFHRWVINRETNLMMLINIWLIHN